MKRIVVFICLIFIIFTFSGCEKKKAETTSSVDEVIINMPADNTVNGYRTEVKVSDTDTPDSISGDDVGTVNSDDIKDNSKEFCGNKNSKVFHNSSCGSVSKMSEHNKYFADRDTLLSEGYKPCGSCKP